MQEMVDNLVKYIQENSNSQDIVLSIVVIIFFGMIKLIFKTSIYKNKDLSKGKKDKLYKKAKSYINLFIILMIVILWFAKIQGVLVSFLAVAAAIVLATKELIMCLTGGFLVTFNRHYKVGDRIEIDGSRGFVLQKTFTTTRLLEIGPEKNSQQTTGNIITIPNSLMLTKSIRNESFFTDYTIKAFSFKVEDTKHFEELESKMLLAAKEITCDYIDIAKKQIKNFCEREGIEIPSVDPKIKLVVDDKNEIHLLLKLPVRNANIADVEQKLLRKYLMLEKG